MAETQNDYVTVKVGAHGFFVEVTAPLKKLVGRGKPDPVLGVSERFLQLFSDHGVPPTQIPRVMPAISLRDLQSSQSLVAVLTPRIIEDAANFFGVRREWIEGASRRMYEPRLCYKSPERFFEELASLKTDPHIFPLFALCVDEKFDERVSRRQPVTLVLNEKVCDIGEREILRYRIFNDEMDWSYPKCHDQIRAMVRLYYRLFQTPVPIYVVSKEDLRAVDAGQFVPGVAASHGRRLHDIWLEDFSLFHDESAASKEDDHLKCAIDQWNKYGLESAVEKMFSRQLDAISKLSPHHDARRAAARV